MALVRADYSYLSQQCTGARSLDAMAALGSCSQEVGLSGTLAVEVKEAHVWKSCLYDGRGGMDFMKVYVLELVAQSRSRGSLGSPYFFLPASFHP